MPSVAFMPTNQASKALRELALASSTWRPFRLDWEPVVIYRAPMRGKFTCVAAVSAIFLAGCAGRRHEGRPAAAPGSWPPQPPPPVANADPSRRHRVSIRVPTGFRVARRGDMLVFNFTSYEKTNLTVGYRMLLGITE